MTSLMLGEHYKMAVSSVRSRRMRSFLTLLGIIVGVVSVITIVSLGEGVKQQVIKEANRLGGDVIAVKPGTNTSANGSPLTSLSGGPSSGKLGENDIKAIESVPDIENVVPFVAISGVATKDNSTYDQGVIIGTTSKMPELSNVKVEFGGFFSSDEETKKVAIIGPRVAEKLFQEAIPIGKSMKIRDQDFIVRGVLEKSEVGLLGTEADFNGAILIPYQTSRVLTGNSGNIYEILVKTTRPGLANQTAANITTVVKKEHGDQQDFTVIKPGDNLLLANNIIRLITGLVGAVAVVSMLIGGISIMNIMLVSVTERSREIGIRKAVGATNRQIGVQFMMEAVVLSLWGAMIGLIVAGFINVVVRITSDFQPVITWQPVVAAVFVSVAVGVVFGTAPAVKASLKDPIEGFRN